MSVEQTVAVRAPSNEGADSTYLQSLNKLKSDLLADHHVVSVARSGSLPGLPYAELSSTMFTRTGADESSGQFEYYYHSVDADFFSTMNISFVAGRNFKTVSRIMSGSLSTRLLLSDWVSNPLKKQLGKR